MSHSLPPLTPQTRFAFWVSVLSLALPVAAQMLLQSLLGMADVVMVGTLGADAIAAVGLAAKIHFLLLVLMSGLATGCSVLIAQYTGARDFASCQRTLAVTLFVGLMVMLPFTFIFGFASPLWVRWINPDPAVVHLASQYLMISAPALILTQLIVIYEASLRALGNTGMPLVAGVVAAVVNVLLNYALIFGYWGFPALGVAGCALGTVIARALQLLVILGWLYLRRHGFALGLVGLRLGMNREQIGRYLAFSLPLVVNYAVWAIGNATYHVVTGFAGTDALAVMGVIVPIESAFFALFVGFANAAAVMIGRELGAGNQPQAWRLHVFFDRLTLLLVAVLSMGLWLLRPWILHIFDQLDGTASQLLMDTLTVFSLLVWLKVLNMIRIIGVLRAGGDNRFCLIVDTIVMWGIGLPIYMAAVFLGNYWFVILYALMFFEDACKFIPVIRRIRQKVWMRNLTRQAEAD